MPSVYQSCVVQDEAAEALGRLKQHLQDVRNDFEAQLAVVESALSDLEGDPTYAAVTLGSTVNNQIRWTAQAAGSAGNRINISYIYLGPEVAGGALVVRLPSSSVDDNSIKLYLGVEVDGTVTANAAWHLFFWLSNTDVTDLVGGALIGAGTDVPDQIPVTYLTGGKNRALTLTESAANEVAKAFNKSTYNDLLEDIDVPVVTSEAEAKQFLEEDDNYIIVNGKLLIVDGTNLVGLNKLYEVTGNDLDKVKEIVATMSTKLPTLVTTQNVSSTTYQRICNVLQALTTVSPTYRNVNTNVNTSKLTYGGDLDSFNLYIFWGEESEASQAAFSYLTKWGIPDEYIGDILSGISATQEDYLEIQAPTVLTIEDLSLLTDLKFTDAELEELLEKNISGVKIPYKVTVADKVKALAKLLRPRPVIRDNGTRSSTKAPIAAMQAVDIASTMDDRNLAKELAARGKACARSTDRLSSNLLNGFEIPNLPDLDLPNLPYDKLPDPAKKIESAFGAVSSAVDFANRMFDSMVDLINKTVMGILNKIQNVASMADNIFNNDIAKCLLGTGTANTGMPEFTGIGMGGGNSIPQLDSVTGGLPIPTSLLKDAFKNLSIDLDETITSAFEQMMKIVQIPLCIVQTLMAEFSGFDLGGLVNPCQDGKDPDDKCPPEDIQAVIDASSDLTSVLDNIPSLEDLPTTQATETVNTTVQKFTGSLQTTVTSTQETVTRGIKQVQEDIQQSINSKVELVEQFDKAIKQLFGEARDIKENIDENAETNSGCLPSQLGLFTDAIADFI